MIFSERTLNKLIILQKTKNSRIIKINLKKRRKNIQFFRQNNWYALGQSLYQKLSQLIFVKINSKILFL